MERIRRYVMLLGLLVVAVLAALRFGQSGPSRLERVASHTERAVNQVVGDLDSTSDTFPVPAALPEP